MVNHDHYVREKKSKSINLLFILWNWQFTNFFFPPASGDNNLFYKVKKQYGKKGKKR